jgi:hypothetical protein
LSTTEKAFDTANKSIEKSFGANGLGEIGKTLDGVNRQVERQIRRSFHTAKKDGNPKKLVRCVKRAHGNTHRIQRCAVKF